MHNKDSEDIRRQWLQQNEKVCICRGIPRKTFIKAIKAGALSIQEVNRIVGSGSGDCNGERCGPKIEQLLNEYQAATKKK
jgi:bacterioferritin-associated ferredoxin